MRDLQVRHDWDGDLCMVTMAGEARMETIERFDEVAREVGRRDDARGVIVDMSQLEFMDSASTGSLLRLHGRMEDRNGKLVMHSLPRFVQRLFDRLGLQQFHLASDAAAAAERL